MNQLEDEIYEIKTLIAFVATASQWESEASFINNRISQEAACGRSYILNQVYERLDATMKNEVIPLTLNKETS